MIEPKELRIGNLVQDVIGLEKSLPVYKLENDIITCGTDLFSYPYLAEQIKPIPLTLEILDNCNLPEDEPKYGSVYFITENIILRRVNYAHALMVEDFGYACEWSSQKEWRVLVERIKYLHQLQNLYFALTGQELKVEL